MCMLARTTLCIIMLLGVVSGASGQGERGANIVILVSDDAGYADFSLHGNELFPTPNIERIAAEGVRFAQGYVSASVCSPSRAGLLTGRYQQRFGHHHNIPAKYSESNGLPTKQRTMADILQEMGYRTIALGKWHLGYAQHFHPLSRGFDDYFGFLQGARTYWPVEGTRLNRLLRDRDPIPETFTYMTDALGDEAARYIEQHADRPFFLYCAFNAVHTPLHAREDRLSRVTQLEGRRRKLAAMTMSLDEAVGTVLDTLDRMDLANQTLVVFVNDNGGQTLHGMENGDLRGRKGQPYEGGIRVPFVARWPGHWPAGLVYEFPVSTLDLLPTALAAAGEADMPLPAELPGVDLTPHVHGLLPGRPHETLFWARRENTCVREGDWKLLRYENGPLELYNLAEDPGETTDRAADYPERVVRLQSIFDAWNAGNEAPRW